MPRLGLGLGLSKFQSGGGAPAAPILDTITGAGRAFGPRRLRTGADLAYRVRRDTDNALTDIGFGPDGWLDEAALLAFSPVGSAFVETAYDQSGNGRDFTQTSNSFQFRIVNAGVVEKQNGRPALASASSTKAMNATPFLFAAGAMTTFFVSTRAPDTVGSTEFFRETGTNAAYRFRSHNSSNPDDMVIDVKNDANVFQLNFQPILLNVGDTTLRAMAFRDSGSSIRGHNNGALSQTQGYTRTGSYTMTASALLLYANSFISEFIQFPSDLSNADFNAVTASQGEAYGITVSPFLSPVEQLAVINGTGDGGQSLGLNLEEVKDNREPAYLDRARHGVWQNGTDFNAIPAANLTSDGELASLPAGQTQAKYLFSSTGGDPAGTRGGRFRLSFTGSATVSFADAGTNVTTIDANTYEFDCTYNPARWLLLTPTAFPIKVSIIRLDELTAHNAGQYFRQEYLDFIPTGATLRFMNAMLTNNSNVVDWADYPSLTSQTWTRMPVAAMVDLCNQKSAHPWFCIPHQATDDFVTQMATYIRDNLNSDLRARFELSNELWNFGINNAGNYFQSQALSMWGTTAGTAWLSAAGKRFVECMNIINSVFSGQTHRVIGVLAGQAGGVGIATGMLDAPEWLANDPSNYVAPYTLAKEWSIGPYAFWFGNTTTHGNNIKTQLDISHAAAVAYIKGMLPDSVAQTKGWIDAHVPLAASRGLRLTGYEYNNHYNINDAGVVASTLYSGGSPVAGALDAFIEATYSQEQADALDEIRDYFKAQNGSLLCLYKGASRAATTGTWGAVQYIGETTATNTAWRAWHTANGRWWAQ